MSTWPEPLRTAGFGIRLAATLFDIFLLFAFVYGPLMVMFGKNLGLLELLVDLALIVFTVWMWQTRGGTPGKLLLGLRVVDAATLRPLSTRQAVGRYFAYLLSSIPLCLGFLWIFFDPRHQAWHDKLSGSLVVHAPRHPDKRPEAASEAPVPALPVPTPAGPDATGAPDPTLPPAAPKPPRENVIQPG